MIIKSVEIEQFRSFKNVSFSLGKYITAISGRNATQKTTLLGLIGQPFTISKGHPMYGCKTIDGYNFKSQFREKFKISPEHDIIGQHKWTLHLYNHIYDKNYYTVKSIARNQSGHAPTLRFWNAESRSRGAGYINIPVYFLSLSRLFPIGESKKTHRLSANLTEEEIKYCLENYRTILSIQHMSDKPSVGLEKGSSARIFAGVSDGIHDIFTNSAGESNVMRIILAILSFKRLKEQYPRYKGGILLIDELDATLYGFSQKQLMHYLLKSAKEYKVQIVFTTHSPIILQCVNDYQREEKHNKQIGALVEQCDNAIVYLKPMYDENGVRTIYAENICQSIKLRESLSDLNLNIFSGDNQLHIYCEDQRAIAFLKYVLRTHLNTNFELYMRFIDVNLGWTNYLQLASKNIPEFKNNIIVLDGDVRENSDYSKRLKTLKENDVETPDNFVFLPLVVEKGLFSLLKKHDSFNQFCTSFLKIPNFNYDVCFNRWPLEVNSYKTNDYKQWYNYIENIVGDQSILFNFWCSKYPNEAKNFLEEFIATFNRIANRNGLDELP